MPARIIGGIITFVSEQLDVNVWDGEVPRYDQNGNPINPFASTTPSSWPVIKGYMKESGFTRTWTTEDAYDDRGDVLIQVWSTTRTSVEDVADTIEALLAQATNWALINLGGPNGNPYYVIQMLLDRYYSGQEEGMRTTDSELIYRYDMWYDTHYHGIVSTQ